MASPRPPGARKPRRRQQVKLTVGEAKATVLDKLEQFLSRHSASEDLGLRLDGEQLAAGVRFVRIVREGSYDVVVGNPPYQGLGKTSFSGYVAKHYPRGKADLYAAFLERGLELTREGGLSALLTMRGWMFLGQFKELRQNVLARFDLRSIGDFDRGAFDEVPNEVLAVAAPVLRKSPYAGLISVAAQPTPLDDKSYDRGHSALDDGLDVLLGRCRRRVKHETLPVPVRRVQSVEEDCVDVRVTTEVAVGALDDGNRAVLAARNTSIRQALAVVGRHGVDEDAQDLA